MPIIKQGDALLTSGNAVASSEACCCGGSGCGGFRAFDRSNRYFRFATLYDHDPLCFFGPVVENGWPHDGGFKVEYTQCNATAGTVTESIYSYSTVNPVGTQHAGDWSNLPVYVSPTRRQVEPNEACGNPTGELIWVELTEEVFCCPDPPVPPDDSVTCRARPTLTIGGNATATVTTQRIEYFGEFYWQPVYATVTNGGSGYSEGGAVSIVLGTSDVEDIEGFPTARVVHAEPILVDVNFGRYSNPDDFTSGSGATFSATWVEAPMSLWPLPHDPVPHRKSYRLSGLTVINGGSGYAVDDQGTLNFETIANGEVVEHAAIFVDAVDDNGAITSVGVYYYDESTPGPDLGPSGLYVGSQTDALHSVKFAPNAGFYHKNTCPENDLP